MIVLGDISYLKVGAFMCNLFAKEYLGELDEITAPLELATAKFDSPELSVV